MKGVCLFGGLGTRLGRYTRRVANKHLVLIGDKTIADFVAEQMVEAGLTRSCFVTGANHAGQLVGYFGDGKEWGFSELEYRFQYAPDGIPSGLAMAASFCQGSPVMLRLGDNIVDHNFFEDMQEFTQHVMQGVEGCRIFLVPVKDPQRFGVAYLENDRVVDLVEKPVNPQSNLAIIGVYLFDTSVFERIENLKKSERGETEIIDLLHTYRADGLLRHRVLNCFYSDAGIPEQIARVMQWYYRKTMGRDIDD